ncbi:Glycosyl transferase family 2 [Pseudobutyrivibrio ruminis]|uniref:Glycosyl transferase family 2 n=1 Tax=Pseudobutyrivibrio ruminis TaxID=46206 RepID=A0A1H7H773_9FIRM|nr:glycosyltransferase family 2 protein [Pseudobutyrivibrio ruminis]SEK46109.1 Glycosyl transferase family 2 [Pseudobutyrivibrio ruminis]
MSQVAIILATYNGEKYIQEQIESIINNSYTKYTIYVCDDGSTDKTPSIVNGLKDKYKDKIVFNANDINRGGLANFLYWTSQIEADYYMFCDQDDVWYENKIQVSLDFIKSVEKGNSDVPVTIFGDANVVDERLDLLHESFFKNENLDASKCSFKDLLMENKLLGCTVMFNRRTQELLRAVDKLPENIRMHDWWIGLIASTFGKVAYYNQPLLMYRQHGNNQVGANGYIEYIMKNIFNWKEQRAQLYAIFSQGESFLNCYRDLLTDDQIEYLEEFSSFYKRGWISRKIRFIKNGYRKTGIMRNLGMWLVV